MHPANAIHLIAQFLEEGLEDLRPDDSEDMPRRISVYRYCLPEPAGAQMAEAEEMLPDSYEGLMPAVVVSPLSWEDKAINDCEAVLTVSIFAGVFSRDAKNEDGPWAVVNILERTKELLMRQRIVGGWQLEDPVSWQLFDESTRPLWFGELITHWRAFAPPLALTPSQHKADHRGDLIRKGDVI